MSTSNLTPGSHRNPLPNYIPTQHLAPSTQLRTQPHPSSDVVHPSLLDPQWLPITNVNSAPPLCPSPPHLSYPMHICPITKPLSMQISISSPLPAPPRPPHPRLEAVSRCQEPFGGDEGCPTEQTCLLEQNHLPGLGMRRTLVPLDDPGLSPYMPWRGWGQKRGLRHERTPRREGVGGCLGSPAWCPAGMHLMDGPGIE